MRFSLNLLLILNLLGAAQALLLACALFSIKRGNLTANRILAAFALVIAISIGGVTLNKTPYIGLFPHLNKIHQPFYFLGAPLLFLYVRALLLRQTGFKRKDLLRVEEAKKRLLDPAKKHYSILAIAEEVGFNSKSSFNLVFKKHAHMTPSEFRKSSRV
jgi:AraC-like DNA-binding protein